MLDESLDDIQLVEMDEQQQLQRAIELSLNIEKRAPPRPDPKGKRRASSVIVISDSDEESSSLKAGRAKINPSNAGRSRQEINPISIADEDSDDAFQADLEKAIQASSKQAPKMVDRNAAGPSTSTQSPLSLRPQPPGTTTGTSLFLRERAKMEAERIARQKRLRPDAAQDDSEETDDEGSILAPTKRFKPNPILPTPVDPQASRSVETDPLFWDGEIRQTANTHAVPSQDTKPTFRLSDILGSKPETIKLVILASYCQDTEWLMKLLPENTPIILVAHAGGQAAIHNILPNWVRTTPFLPAERGCMHMKFMLVFYSTGRLRLMITTANFIAYDWRDIENSAWVQDLPLRKSHIEHDPTADDFPAQFQYVLHKLNVQPALQSHLKGNHPHLPLRGVGELRARWDWSRVTVHLVVSVYGNFQGAVEVARSGHLSLRKAIIDAGASCPKGMDLSLECQGSSIGTYSSSWLNEFLFSAKGKPISRWFAHKGSYPKAKDIPLPQTIKIMFPSLRTVDASALGRQGGRTMFCREKQWSAPTFPRKLFYDSKSKRGPILMHSKMILGLFVGPSPPNLDDSRKGQDDHPGGWCYVGSHNFTPSAWGTLSGSSSKPVMNVANYELGILIPLSKHEIDAQASGIACWQRPARKYDPEIDEPWVRLASRRLQLQ